MSENLCVRCERPTPDGTACANCAYRAGDQLHDIADMTPAARDIATGQARHAAAGGSGKPGSSLPFDLTATSKLDAVQNTFTTWSRHVAAERGIAPPWVTTYGDPIAVACGFLAGHIEWLRHRAEVAEALVDIEAAHRVVRSIARGPSEQKFLGPCGAELVAGAEGGCPVNCACHNGPYYACDEPGGCGSAGCGQPRPTGKTCQGDVYAYRGAKVGRCRTCKAEVATAEREAWLDGEVRQHAFRASHIADAYGVSVDTIRSWAARGQLKSYWRTAAGIVADWAEPPEGETRDRLHYVADVLDLAAAAAARRETERAKRERRKAEREQGEPAA